MELFEKIKKEKQQMQAGHRYIVDLMLEDEELRRVISRINGMIHGEKAKGTFKPAGLTSAQASKIAKVRWAKHKQENNGENHLKHM